MPVTPVQLDEGLEKLRQRACAEEAPAAEFARARNEFLGRAEPASAAAERRFVEWFLLERPSAALGGVPIELTVHSEAAEDFDEGVLGALVSSTCGVFEVTGVSAGEGAWVRDLAALGEYALDEPEGSNALAAGDLLAGRLFAVGDQLHRISPGAVVFRDASLRAALFRDFDRARGSRRGVVRLSQLELERLFQGVGEPTVEPGEALRQAREFFFANGLDEDRVAELFAELASQPFDPERPLHGGGDALGAILDQLAFETPVDLERARRHLLASWAALSPAVVPTGADEQRDARGDVRTAIAAFDRGRSEGKDLEQLFKTLERDLELDDEAGGAEDSPAPDFPGVVAAMVAEYAWEQQRERAAGADERIAALAPFSEFGEQFGVFENLGARELLWFAGVWLFEHDKAESPAHSLAILGALESFCQWCEREQDVALATALAPHAAGLREALPRLTIANRARAAGSATAGELFELREISGASAVVRDRSGGEQRVDIAAAVAAHIRAGDRLRAERQGAQLRVYCCYPAASAALER